MRVRFRRLLGTDAVRNRVVDVREDTRRDAAEERRAVRGSLRRHGGLEREVEHGRDDPPPQRGPGAPARDPCRTRVDAELAQKLERVAQAEGHPFQHRADESAAVVPQLEPDERAARIRVGVWRALTGQVGREEQPVDPGRPPLRLVDELAERGLSSFNSPG